MIVPKWGRGSTNGTAKWRRWIIAGGFVALFALALAGAGEYYAVRLTTPAHTSVGKPPDWFTGEPVSFPSQSGAKIHGWYLAVPDAEASVVLLHPVRGNRRSMLGRARFLFEAGFSVLLIDLQAHGESLGEHISYGSLESHDARAAVEFMKAQSQEVPIIVLGVSLGGAAAVLADPPLGADGLILEAVFPSIEKAVENRMRMRAGALGAAVLRPFMWQLTRHLGVDATQLQPARASRDITIPVFIISGRADQRTTVADTERFYNAFISHKQLWLVPEAKHEDLHAFAGEEYETRVLAFIRAVIERTH